MKKLFKDWKAFEIGLLIISVLSVLVSAIVFKSQILTLMTSLTGILCSLLQAKGKIMSQFVGLLEVILYPILSKPVLWGSYYLCFYCISHVPVWCDFMGNA